jgi:hypothetical protein
MLTSKVQGHAGAQFELSGLMFSADITVPTKPVAFRLERAEETAFEANRYYSIAPLETDAHLELLENLEAFLSS